MAKKSQLAAFKADSNPVETGADHAVLVNLDTIQSLIPISITQDQLRQFERTGKFPRGLRLISSHAAPLWPVETIIAWLNENFRETFPKHCAKAERVLREHRGSTLTAYHRDKPRVTIYSTTDGSPREETVPNARDLVATGAYTRSRPDV